MSDTLLGISTSFLSSYQTYCAVVCLFQNSNSTHSRSMKMLPVVLSEISSLCWRLNYLFQISADLSQITGVVVTSSNTDVLSHTVKSRLYHWDDCFGEYCCLQTTEQSKPRAATAPAAAQRPRKDLSNYWASDPNATMLLVKYWCKTRKETEQKCHYSAMLLQKCWP